MQLPVGKLHSLSKKRLSLPISAKQWVEMASMDIKILPITKEIALLSEQLDSHHKDPADRFIIATSISNAYYQPRYNLSKISRIGRFID